MATKKTTNNGNSNGGNQSQSDFTADVEEVQGTMIDEPVRVWDSPGSPNLRRPPTPGRLGVLSADITKEYVSGRPNNWYLNLLQVLPFYVDDITQRWGDDLYQRMMFDPIVASSVNTLKAAVLEDGITLRPAILDENNPNFEIARWFQAEAEELLDRYDGNAIDDWMWQVADAIWRGHSVSEITYYVDESLGGRPQYFLKRLAAKTPGTYGFAIDTYENIVGITGLTPGVGMPVQIGTTVVDPDSWPNLYPREHFGVYTHRPRDEDPRGVSILRPVYTPWNLKMQVLPEYAKWLKQFASPSLLGFTAADAMQIPLVDAEGNPLVGSDGNVLTGVSPEQNMLGVLQNVMNGSAGVFPNGSDVKWIEMRGMGNPFLFAFRFFNEEIATGIMGQSMTSLSQKYGTQALGGIQENTFDTTVHQVKAGLAHMFFRDLLRNWVKYNFGAKYQSLTPKPYLGQIEKQDFKGDLNALSQSGFSLDPSQFPELDKRMGLPIRAANWQELQAEATARKTFLEQEGWSGGSTTGQILAEAMVSGQGKPTANDVDMSPGGAETPQKGQQGGSKEKDQAEQIKQAQADARHERAVKMAQEVYKLTGIKIRNVDAPPPSAAEVRKMFGLS